MSIGKYLDKIRNAVYGREVRESIAKGIETAYNDAAEKHDNANMEVKLARGTHSNLNNRLDKMDEVDKQTTTQLAQIHVNVRDYGAIGDGVTDDWQAITDAITTARQIYGAVVYFPRGNYAVSKTIKWQTSIKFVGRRGGATISALDTVEDCLIEGVDVGALRIKDLGLWGNPNIDAIFTNNANGSRFTNIIFTTFKNGINSYGSKDNFTDGSWAVEVRDCYFNGMEEYGVQMLYGSNMTIISENQFWKSNNAILIRNGYSNNIKNNIIQEMTGIGVNLESTHMATVETNYFERNGKDIVITKAEAEPAEGISYKIEVLNNLFVSGTSGIITTVGVDVVHARQTVIRGNWSRAHDTAFVVIGANSQQTKIEDNYSLHETAVIDNGWGTIFNRLFDDKEVLNGKFELDGTLQLQDESILRLGNTPVNTTRTMFFDETLGLLSIRDGNTQRKAGYPAGAKALTSSASIRVEGVGSPDRFPIQPDPYYNVHLSSDKPVIAWYTDKKVDGFTINIKTPDGTPIPYPVGVSWTISRQ